MLFNSYAFIFLFLPVVVAGFFFLARGGRHEPCLLWLVAASLVFYGWNNPYLILLLAGSILFNFGLGMLIERARDNGAARPGRWLAAGVVGNLVLLGTFKYTNFLIATGNDLFDLGARPLDIVLPLAISFFTFQQIAYLADVARGETRERSLIRYGLFVAFFPQLVAGPIVHHKEMLPQFLRPEILKPRARNFAIGLSIFSLGLFKKVAIADSCASYADPVFAAADAGLAVMMSDGWIATLAFTFQIYFDFSGYSDMAIGLAYAFGIALPINFASPYKATSIVDFWRRWHITLSRFLRDYLYVPLGGNRLGRGRRYGNLMATMLLGGLWHGAGWTFVVWGGLHGLYLAINHAWHRLVGPYDRPTSAAWKAFAWSLTFLAVSLAWVFFRAGTFGGALELLRVMLGGDGLVLPAWYLDHPLAERLNGLGIGFATAVHRDLVAALQLLAFCLAVVLLLPNSIQWLERFEVTLQRAPARGWLQRRLQWRPSVVWAAICAGLFLLATAQLAQPNKFLYFEF